MLILCAKPIKQKKIHVQKSYLHLKFSVRIRTVRLSDFELVSVYGHLVIWTSKRKNFIQRDSFNIELISCLQKVYSMKKKNFKSKHDQKYVS